ncbi:MAG TPA: DUF2069 domain-containing protein [Solimonas sp.]
MKPSVPMHALAVACHLALITGLLYFGDGRLALLFGLLLLLPLPGLLRGNARTHAWSSMMISFYCAAFASNAYSSAGDARTLWFVFATLAALEFTANMLFVRFLARERRIAAT